MDLDGDGIDDKQTTASVADNQGNTQIAIMSSRTQKISSANLPLGRGGISQGYFDGTFDLYLDYYPDSPDIRVYSFEWSPAKEDWLLYKVSYWLDESHIQEDLLEDHSPSLPRAFKVERIACCTTFSSLKETSDIRGLKDDQARQSINEDLKKIISEKNDVGKHRKIPLHLSFEIANSINESNVREINDLAYFLYLREQLTSAAIILEALHKKYPDRVVATLNLADTYWKINMSEMACPLYMDYVDRMKALGKTEKIPKVAYERSHCS